MWRRCALAPQCAQRGIRASLFSKSTFLVTRHITTTAAPLAVNDDARAIPACSSPCTNKEFTRNEATTHLSTSTAESPIVNALHGGGLPSPCADSSSPRRKLRCLRGAYHASRSVAQLLLPLLEPATTSSPSRRVSRRGACPLSADLTHLHECLSGTPTTLEHEGPLQDTHLLGIRDVATHAAVTNLCTHLFDGALCPETTTSASSLWTSENVQRYQQALLAARHARLRCGGTFNGYEHLKEAGEIMRSTFCEDSSAPSGITEEWRRLIRLYTAFLPDRSHIHELENLPQEVAIGELLCEAAAAAATEAATTSSASSSGACGGVCRPLDCVVDVGGGNGFLAAQVAERLGCDGVVIDPLFPAHAIDCCPRLWPDTAARRHPATRRRQTLHRTTALFRDVRWADVVPAPPSRTALVAKHLCGSGVDEVLRQLEAQDCLPRVLVLAPCCFNKITYDTYCDPAYLQEVMGITSEAGLARVHKLTDWNMSCYQSSHEALLANAEAQRRGHRRNNTQGASGACDCFSHSSTFAGATSSGAFSYQRRSGPRSIVNSITCTHAFALLVEGLLNYGRMQWLRRRNYEVRLVQYVPDVVTPKNKCLLAVRKGK